MPTARRCAVILAVLLLAGLGYSLGRGQAPPRKLPPHPKGYVCYRAAKPPKIDGRLAKIIWQQLRVTVGEVQQVDVAEARQLVKRFCVVRSARGGRRTPCDGEAGSRCGCEHVQELAAVHRATIASLRADAPFTG